MVLTKLPFVCVWWEEGRRERGVVRACALSPNRRRRIFIKEVEKNVNLYQKCCMGF